MLKNKNENKYIHLGGNVAVFNNDIIGIFDIEKTTVEKSVNDFLSYSQKQGKIYYCSLDMPKSFTLAGETVYVSNVAVNTLKKRVKD